MCEYRYQGDTWCIELPAESWEDAEARLRRMAYGKVLGEIQATVRLGWLERTIAGIRRFVRSFLEL